MAHITVTASVHWTRSTGEVASFKEGEECTQPFPNTLRSFLAWFALGPTICAEGQGLGFSAKHVGLQGAGFSDAKRPGGVFLQSSQIKAPAAQDKLLPVRPKMWTRVRGVRMHRVPSKEI